MSIAHPNLKTCSNKKCNLVKPLSEFDKLKTTKDGLNSWCKECCRIYKSIHYKKNKDGILNKNAIYQHENKKRINSQRAEYRLKNKEKIALQHLEYRLKNKEKIAIKKAEYMSVYYAKNKKLIDNRNATYDRLNQGRKNARIAKRRALKVEATPKWLTADQLMEIENFYIKANDLSKTTGISYHVDHIVPIQGKNIRGLHVPWNLQILTGHENVSKGNKLIS